MRDRRAVRAAAQRILTKDEATRSLRIQNAYAKSAGGLDMAWEELWLRCWRAHYLGGMTYEEIGEEIGEPDREVIRDIVISVDVRERRVAPY